MTARLSRVASLIVSLAVIGVTVGCGFALRNPAIAELRENPGRYQNHSVSIDGYVTTSWGVPLVPFRMYKVDDGTGEVTVVSQGSRIPTRGAHVRVKGRVDELGVIGGQPLGLHLREEHLSVRRR
jgi:hypothetical protein